MRVFACVCGAAQSRRRDRFVVRTRKGPPLPVAALVCFGCAAADKWNNCASCTVYAYFLVILVYNRTSWSDVKKVLEVACPRIMRGSSDRAVQNCCATGSKFNSRQRWQILVVDHGRRRRCSRFFVLAGFAKRGGLRNMRGGCG